MDKIRLSISTQPEDFARLYSAINGFEDSKFALNFPGDSFVSIFISSMRSYELSITGDAGLAVDSSLNLGYLKCFMLSWSDLSWQAGKGHAVITIHNPDSTKLPSTIELTMGECGFAHVRVKENKNPHSGLPEFVAALIADIKTLTGDSMAYCGPSNISDNALESVPTITPNSFFERLIQEDVGWISSGTTLKFPAVSRQNLCFGSVALADRSKNKE